MYRGVGVPSDDDDDEDEDDDDESDEDEDDVDEDEQDDEDDDEDDEHDEDDEDDEGVAEQEDSDEGPFARNFHLPGVTDKCGAAVVSPDAKSASGERSDSDDSVIGGRILFGNSDLQELDLKEGPETVLEHLLQRLTELGDNLPHDEWRKLLSLTAKGDKGLQLMLESWYNTTKHSGSQKFVAAVEGVLHTSLKDTYCEEHNVDPCSPEMNPPTRKPRSEAKVGFESPGKRFKSMANDVSQILHVHALACDYRDIDLWRLNWDYKLLKTCGLLKFPNLRTKRMAVLVCLSLSGRTRDKLCISVTANLCKEGYLDPIRLSTADPMVIRDLIR